MVLILVFALALCGCGEQVEQVERRPDGRVKCSEPARKQHKLRAPYQECVS